MSIEYLQRVCNLGGDVFEVIDNGKSIGKTSELQITPGTEPLYAATPEEAFEDARFSKAAYLLEAGAHEITIKVADSVNENGTGAVRVVQKIQSLWGKKHEKHDDDDEDDEDNDDEEDDDKKDWKKKEEKIVEKIVENHTETVYKKKFKTETDTLFVYFTVTETVTKYKGGVGGGVGDDPTTTVTVTTTVPTSTGTVTTTTTTTTTEIVTPTEKPIIPGCYEIPSVTSGFGDPLSTGGTGLLVETYEQCILTQTPTCTTGLYGTQYRVRQNPGTAATFYCLCIDPAEFASLVPSGECNLFESASDSELYYYGANVNNVFLYRVPPPEPVSSPIVPVP